MCLEWLLLLQLSPDVSDHGRHQHVHVIIVPPLPVFTSSAVVEYLWPRISCRQNQRLLSDQFHEWHFWPYLTSLFSIRKHDGWAFYVSVNVPIEILIYKRNFVEWDMRTSLLRDVAFSKLLNSYQQDLSSNLGPKICYF